MKRGLILTVVMVLIFGFLFYSAYTSNPPEPEHEEEHVFAAENA